MGTTNSKNTIMNIAMNLFSSKGFDNVGVNEIVQKAGVTKPTLYYFFDSKEGVFQAILEKYYKQFNDQIRSASVYVPNTKVYHKDVFPVLTKLAETYFNFAQENSEFYMLLLSLTFAPPTASVTQLSKPYIEEQYHMMTDLFLNISNSHGNLKGREFQIASSLIALINANIVLWYNKKGNLDKKTAESIVHQFMHGMFA